MNCDDRIAALRARLEKEQVAAIAVTHVSNVEYLTGFEGVCDSEAAHVALVTATDCVMYTDSRYAEAAQVAAEVTAWRIVVARSEVLDEAKADLTQHGVERVALETSMPHGRYERFRTGFAGEVVPASGWVEEIRAVKEPGEIERIEAAQALTDAAFMHIRETMAVGVSEREIALELEFFMRREGSDGVAFPPIVASGPNSARPHATVSDRRLVRGDFVVMDFGARIGGYCADMTRTVVVGPASDRHREIYSAVLEANLAGTAAMAPGALGKEIDAAARQVLEERGLAEYFGHGLGHGVGLEVHELPTVGRRSEVAVPAGSVITCEPGVYVPGFGGVRIEDLIVVESSGPRVLTKSRKDLIEI
ncbi:MAG: M24 family metallopeptidase [Coriobacteriia bacterium]